MSDLLKLAGKFRMESTDTETVIHIDGIIGSCDFWGDYSAAKLRRELAMSAAPTVRVIINSPGGEVFEGMAIYDALKSSGKKIVTKSAGVAASIASVIFLAGEERVVSDGSFVMIHNVWSWAMGDAAQVRKTADLLDKLTGEIAALYAKVAGGTAEEMRALMNAESWFSRSDAEANGFATTAPEAAVEAPAAQNLSPFAPVFALYRNTPKSLLSKPTAGQENNPKNTTTMSDKNKPAGAAPRNEIPQEDFDALVARVTAAESSITALIDRVTKLEEANATASEANAKLKTQFENQSKELDAIKAKTPASPAAKPSASGSSADAPKSKDEQIEALSASLAKETDPAAKFKIAAEIKKLRRS